MHVNVDLHVLCLQLSVANFYLILQICQSVWSPQSVEMAVQEFCEPFLRMAALVKFHLFGDQFADRRVSNRFTCILLCFINLNLIEINQPWFRNTGNIYQEDCK